MSYLKSLRYTRSELEDLLDLPETDYLNEVECSWDNIMQQWVFSCLIEQGAMKELKGGRP